MMKQAVEDRAGGRDIAEQFAPFFDGSIGGHHGGTVLVTAHDDFQKDLAAFTFLRRSSRGSCPRIQLRVSTDIPAL